MINRLSIFFLYVNDILIASMIKVEITELKAQLNSDIEIKDHG